MFSFRQPDDFLFFLCEENLIQNSCMSIEYRTIDIHVLIFRLQNVLSES